MALEVKQEQGHEVDDVYCDSQMARPLSPVWYTGPVEFPPLEGGRTVDTMDFAPTMRLRGRGFVDVIKPPNQ